MSRSGYDLQRDLAGCRDCSVEAAKELQQDCLAVRGHLVELLQNEHAAAQRRRIRMKACSLNCDERPIASGAQTMQFRCDEILSGAAVALNRADTQVRNGTLHLLEEPLNGGRSPNDGRIASGNRHARGSRRLSLGMRFRVTGEQNAGDDAQKLAGGCRWSHDCGLYRQRLPKDEQKRNGVLDSTPVSGIEARCLVVALAVRFPGSTGGQSK